jgi:Cys-rich protein (TIGR01571 family)
MAKVEGNIGGQSTVVVQPATTPPAAVQWQQSQQQLITMQVSTIQGYPQNIRQWSSPLCNCCDNMSSCCCAFWCYPCFQCGLAKRMGECVCGPFFLGTAFQSSMRTRLRAEYGIQGTILDDCCTAAWCSCCMTLQMERELDHIGYPKK